MPSSAATLQCVLFEEGFERGEVNGVWPSLKRTCFFVKAVSNNPSAQITCAIALSNSRSVPGTGAR